LQCQPGQSADPIFQNYPAYLLLKNAGFVDAFRPAAAPNDPGYTCCQPKTCLM